MYVIDRGVAIIRPKQPFVDWINGLPDAEMKVTLDDLRNDCLAVLISPFVSEEDAMEEIAELYAEIFTAELTDWCPEQTWWPQRRDLEAFRQWFDIEVHALVTDPFDEEIRKEPY